MKSLSRLQNVCWKLEMTNWMLIHTNVPFAFINILNDDVWSSRSTLWFGFFILVFDGRVFQVPFFLFLASIGVAFCFAGIWFSNVFLNLHAHERVYMSMRGEVKKTVCIVQNYYIVIVYYLGASWLNCTHEIQFIEYKWCECISMQHQTQYKNNWLIKSNANVDFIFRCQRWNRTHHRTTIREDMSGAYLFVVCCCCTE